MNQGEGPSGWQEGPAILARLAEFAEKYKQSPESISDDERREIDKLILDNGRDLTMNSGLYSEYTSENIAFIELPNGLNIEVSISGSFNASFVRVLDDAGVEKRLDEIDKINRELEEREKGKTS